MTPHEPGRVGQMVRWTTAALIGAVLAGRVMVAHACSCAPPRPWLLFPDGDDAAPLNTRVVVHLPPPEPGQLPGTLALRSDMRWITVDRTEVGPRASLFVELSPRALLAPRTRYQVVLVRAGEPDAVVGAFTTTEHADREAPAHVEIGEARYVTYDGEVARAKKSRKPFARTSCDTYPFILVKLAGFDEDSTDSSHFAVWVGGPTGTIRYDRPPATVARAYGGRLRLGRSVCMGPNLELPPRGGRMRLGLREMDLAGNLGPPAEVNVELR